MASSRRAKRLKRVKTNAASTAWELWRTFGAPRYAAAPMVWQSERCFRLLARRNGVGLAYTPMVNARSFVESYTPKRDSATRQRSGEDEWRYDTFRNVRSDVFPNDAADRPLVLQFCATNAEEFAAAASLASREFGSCIDMIDLNLGCPQRSARLARFGAFLMDEAQLVAKMVKSAVVAAAPLPVSAKIRVLDSVEATVRFALLLEAAGASVIAIHGRTRSQRHHEGSVHVATIAAVVQAVSIPVIANGAVRTRLEAEAMLASTGAACCMAATGLLADFSLFRSPLVNPDDVEEEGEVEKKKNGEDDGAFGRAFEYLAAAKECPPPHHRFIKDHLLALLRNDYLSRTDDPLYHMIVRQRGVTELRQYYELVRILARRESQSEPEPERELWSLKEVKLARVEKGMQ
tara:strand:- start:625 stop:1839 length:1215 start_codon:yes stop_codon:yes gene_type:complete